MIVVIDTNVVVSGIMKVYSPSAAILGMAATGRITPAYDLRILSEYKDVLRREKFSFDPNLVQEFLSRLEEDGMSVICSPLGRHLPDRSDEPFLEVAMAASAEALVTGNKRHYPARAAGRCNVLTPVEFIERLSD